MPKVKFGVTYSERDDFSDLVPYAQKMEELGYDSLWVTENITSNAPALECFTALSFMAACTSKILIGPSVMLLPLRNPVLVAQTAASLDILSGGRFILGVGVGGPGGRGSEDRDYTAYGGSVRERGSRADESLEVIKRLWTEPSVTFQGRHFHLQQYTLLPRPLQKPHPSIWVGGHAEASFKRAGRWADAYNPVAGTPKEMDSMFQKVERYGLQYGRDPASTARTLHIYACLADTPQEAARIGTETLSKRYQAAATVDANGPYLIGPLEHCRKVLQSFIDVGVSHFVFNMVCNPKDASSQAEVIAKEVLPAFR